MISIIKHKLRLDQNINGCIILQKETKIFLKDLTKPILVLKDFKATLCQEIELLLRYKELTDNKVNKTYRHFYEIRRNTCL